MPHAIRIERTRRTGSHAMGRRAHAGARPRGRYGCATPPSASISSTSTTAPASTSGAQLPFTPGAEAAGVVDALGEGVSGLKAGDRVVYQTASTGSYAEYCLIPADRAIKLPDGIDDKTAAAGFLKGVTVEYLLLRTFKVGPEHTVLFHAAAGGVGTHRRPVAEGARRHHHRHGRLRRRRRSAPAPTATITSSTTPEENFVERVREITGGEQVRRGLRFGRQGHLSGLARLPEAARHVGLLRPVLRAGAAVPDQPAAAEGRAFRHPADDRALFRQARRPRERAPPTCSRCLRDGTVKVEIGQTFPLKDAAEAHRALEARRTTGRHGADSLIRTNAAKPGSPAEIRGLIEIWA